MDEPAGGTADDSTAITTEPGSGAVAADPVARDPRDVMPAWVPRAILIFLVGVAGLFTLRWLLVELQSFLVLIVVSLFLSFALEPAVNWLNRNGIRRGLATGMVMLGSLAATVAFLVLLGQALFTQVSDFIEDLPNRVERIEHQVNERFDTELDADELVKEVQSKDVQGLATDLGTRALDLGISALGLVFNLFTIALFTFYMVADGPRFRRSVLSFLSPTRQERVAHGWEIAIQKTGGYIYSRGVLAFASAVVTTAVLGILDVDYALALGLWTGLVSQFIPTIGTYLAGALPVLVALLDDPGHALIILAFLLIYQQIENYLFAPKITAKTMDLHPAVAFGTVMVGAALFGGVGALIALPAAAVIQAIATTYLNRHEVIDTHMTRDHRREPDASGRPNKRSASRAATPDPAS
ncbi:MAG: AI-2E family transporter [Microthrixaceae bacterium]|nr:AI-2E family transporter [Acidimicrobiales bacterium]MCB9404125.1 AI-2E family transporter [Microthrixaceae bacterium]